MSTHAESHMVTNGDYQDYRDLTLPLDPDIIFEASPADIESIVYVKRQHELLDLGIQKWISNVRECQSDSLESLQSQVLQLTQGTTRDIDGNMVQGTWTHQQRLMQALYSIGSNIQICPPETLPILLELLKSMVLDPIQECCQTIAKTILSAKLFYRQAISLYDESINKYHSMTGKKNMSSGGEICQTARKLLDRKKELCKAIYALSGTLNSAIAFKESFILEKASLETAHIFLTALYTWRTSGKTDSASLKCAFDKPLAEVHRFSVEMFPPIQFPQDDFKTHFARFCHSLMLPVSLGDLESLDPIVPIPGRKTGYLFLKCKSGEWSREYFYIQPNGMLMQWSKGKHIHVANLKQTLLRVVRDDKRDFVFEICSIEVYLMESILQATTKVEFEEWKAALFYWHPPDDDIPQIDKLKISTPPSKPMLPRPRHLSTGRAPEQPVSFSKPRVSTEFPVVIKGDLFALRSKPMSAQNKLVTWKRITCHIRSNGHFVQYNVGENDKPFETIPLADTLRTHVWALDSSLFSKKHCFSIKTLNDVNYYTVSTKRSSSDQEIFNTWLYILKSYAKPEVFGVTEILEYRLYRTFRITVNDCRRLPKDLEAYCEIMLDDQRRARTSTRMKATKNSDQDAPFWRDSFEFTDLAAFTKGITINVIQAKGNKAIPFGRTYIPVRNNEESDEGWYPILRINDRTKSTEHPGDLRLKLKYEEQIVLPLSNYVELLEIILNYRENNVISKLAEHAPDLEGFAKNVLRILEGRDLAIPWLNSLIDDEIAEADPTRVNTLFRGNTLLTKALDAYMRLVGTEYLDDTLGDILRGICMNKIACEVDPSRLDKNDDVRAQWKTLKLHTRTCWRAVTDSVDRFPKELLRVFSHLQRRLTEKFSGVESSSGSSPDSELASQARYTGVSGFVFLRLICPAILSPRLFHVVKDHPEPHAHRTLTLIAKSLQGLANLVNFGTKEEWMYPMNDFIKTDDTGSSGAGSSTNSVHSLSLHAPPHSPGSINSSTFKVQTRNGNYQSSISSGFGGGALVMAPLPSPSSQTRSCLRPPNKETVQPPIAIGNIDVEISMRNQDMPLLPHLIDLGKELALFTKTVAHVIKTSPEKYEDLLPLEDSSPGLEMNGSHSHVDEEQGREDEDILRTVARACLYLLNTIGERVDLSVEYEQRERQRAALIANGRVIQELDGTHGIHEYAMSKMSREASRDGEESIIVFENYDGHEVECFEGNMRGSYDSDDESMM
ncbi:hypothetical protein BGX27_005089 [Mortierella sp. AM989]|nr:hypothetical protein BGX27_005089 [Mortierella sp. AM989]